LTFLLFVAAKKLFCAHQTSVFTQAFNEALNEFIALLRLGLKMDFCDKKVGNLSRKCRQKVDFFLPLSAK